MTKKPPETNQVCFVASPIGAADSDTRIHADWVLDGIIRPALSQKFPEMLIERSDRMSVPGQINSQVIEKLLTSKLVIADLSLLNANVFYEIGVRHMAQLPIIHMQLDTEAVPFDNSIYRTLKFSTKRHTDIEAAKILLSKMVEAVLDPRYEVDNPVIETQGKIKLREIGTPSERLLANELESIKLQMSNIEGYIRRRSPASKNAVFGSQILNDYEMSEYNLRKREKIARHVLRISAPASSKDLNSLRDIIDSFIGSSTSVEYAEATGSRMLFVVGPKDELDILIKLLSDYRDQSKMNLKTEVFPYAGLPPASYRQGQ